MIIVLFLLSSCKASVDNLSYKNDIGYEAYISDFNTGYDDATFYFIEEAMETSKQARDFYKSNNRRCGDYIITDYEDGVCINRYVGLELSDGSILEIPEKIDNKLVVKIGGYVSDDETKILGAFSGNTNFTLKIPSTVKYIGNLSFLCYSGIISDDDRKDFTFISSIEVSADNPYYWSNDGALYTKDRKSLLYEPKLEWICSGVSYTVPDFIETFEPSNGVDSNMAKIVIGNNVNKINTFIDRGENTEDWVPDIVVFGYKDTVAEKWAEEQNTLFKEIEDLQDY